MGKARIVESLGEGKYRVIPLYEGRRLIREKILAAGEYAESDLVIEHFTQDLEALDAIVKAKIEDLNKAIREKSDTKEATKALQEAEKPLFTMQLKISHIKISSAAACKRSKVPGLVTTPIFEYCAYEYRTELEENRDQLSSLIPSLDDEVNQAENAEVYARQVVEARVAEIAWYEERIPPAKAALDAAIEQARLNNADLAAELDAARASGDEEDIAAAQQAYDQAIAADTATERAAYDEVANGLRAAKGQLEAAQKALEEARTALLEARKKRARTIAQRDKITEILDLAEEAPPVTAWCADYNENLAGEVGTIEPGRVDREGTLIIRPGGVAGDQAGYDAARDGILQPMLSATPASAFYNYALLPGVAKWCPRYRIGVITALDSATGLAEVALDPLYSTHQDLNINQTDRLDNVPIQYMGCNADVFQVGDRVVVEF